jgi:hypothetical protein
MYTIADFQTDIQNVKPRKFDTYILPAFLVWFAIASKKEMGKNWRRVLFISGVYMGFRSYNEYKALAARVAALMQQPGESTPV